MRSNPKFDNVFVLSTGRTGTMTFNYACRHIKNYTSSHESLCREYGQKRLDYPKYHIEIDNRLVWMLGRLENTFGKEAFYVHMKRRPEDVAKSYLNRRLSKIGIMAAYHRGILKRYDQVTMESAMDLVKTVNTNIDLFLKDKPNKMVFHIDNSAENLSTFFKLIGADVDLYAARAEMTKKRNVSKKRSWAKSLVQGVKMFLKYKILKRKHN